MLPMDQIIKCDMKESLIVTNLQRIIRVCNSHQLNAAFQDFLAHCFGFPARNFTVWFTLAALISRHKPTVHSLPCYNWQTSTLVISYIATTSAAKEPDFPRELVETKPEIKGVLTVLKFIRLSKYKMNADVVPLQLDV